MPGFLSSRPNWPPHLLASVAPPPLVPGGGVCNTQYTELHPLLSGVHSVMRVKSVVAGEGGGARPPPPITFTLTSKAAVYAPAEWADTLTLFHLYQYMYSTLWC